MRAENTLGPAHLPNGFEALGVVDEVLDLHQPSAGRVFDFHASVSGVFLPKRAYATGALSCLYLARSQAPSRGRLIDNKNSHLYGIKKVLCGRSWYSLRLPPPSLCTNTKHIMSLGFYASETSLPRISRNEHQSPFHQASCKPRLDFGLNSKPAGIELFPHFGNVGPAMPSSLCGPCPCRW